MSVTITIPTLSWWQWGLVAYAIVALLMLARTRRLKLSVLWPLTLLALCFGTVQ